MRVKRSSQPQRRSATRSRSRFPTYPTRTTRTKVEGLVGYVVGWFERLDARPPLGYTLFKTLNDAWEHAVEVAMEAEGGEYDKSAILERMEAKPKDADFVSGSPGGRGVLVYPPKEEAFHPGVKGALLMIFPVSE